MPAFHEIVPRLEGLAGFVAGSTDVDTQPAYDWIEAAKWLVRRPLLRGLTTWEFALSDDVDETANVVLANAGTVYGILIDFADVTTMEVARLTVRNTATTFTFDATAAAATSDFIYIRLPANATTGVSEFHGFLYPNGVTFGTGITVGAEDEDGSTFGSDVLGAWFLYTDDS